MPDTVGADTTSAGNLRVNGVVYSAVDSPFDEDWYRVSLIGGRTYRIDLMGLSSGSGTLADPIILGVYNSGGIFLPGTIHDDITPHENFDSRLLFTPTTTGTYYIDATVADSTSVGTYRLAITDISAPDVPATAATAFTVPLGLAGVQGLINVAGDVDWYKASLVAGRTYRVEMRGEDSNNGTLADTVIRGIRDAGGLLLPFSGNDDAPGTLDSRVEFIAGTTGTHTIDVAAYAGLTGSFNLRVIDITLPDVPDNTASTAAVVVNGLGTVGRLETTTDMDWFRVTLTAGVTYSIEMLGLSTGHGSLHDPLITSIRNAAGAVVQAGDDDGGLGTNSRMTFTPGTTGTYFIEAADAAVGGIGTYRVSVRTGAAPLDVLATVNTTASAVVGGSVLGRVDVAGDVDWFRAALLPGRVYRIDLTGDATDGATLADPFLRGLYDGTGTLIDGTANDDFGVGNNSRVVVTSPGGTLFIAAGGYGAGTGNYNLSVTDITPFDRSANTATLGTIALGSQVASRIDAAGDQDWFRVSLTSGRLYTFDMVSDGNSPVALPDTLIAGIYNNAGVLIPNTTNDDYGASLDSRVSFIASYTGDHYISAAAFGDAIGDYVLSARAVGNVVDTISNTLATTGRVTVGGFVAGEINSAFDEDWFAVSMLAGTTYTINLRGEPSGNGTLLDPRLIGIYSNAGILLPGTPNDDAPGTRDAQTTFRATATGTFYIAAGGYGSGVGTYRLSVETAAPSVDVASNVTTTANVVANGAIYAGNIDTSGDVDWVRLSVTAGTSYVANMLGAPSANGTLADARIMGVFNGQGMALSSELLPNAGGSLDSRATFTSTYTGNAYIALRSENSGTGTYKLDVDTTTLADPTAPRLVSSSPSDNATGVSSASNITLIFNEAVRAGSGNIHLTRLDNSEILIPVNSSQVSFSGEVMTINPTANLADFATYYVNIDAGAVRDIAGNNFAGITNFTGPNFTTATVPADTWTLMVYVAADNDLEEFALSDLNEMESVVGMPGLVNIMVMVDRSPGYSTGSGDWSDTRRGRIVHENTSINVTSLDSFNVQIGERNMGDASNLTDFIDWAHRNAPAQNYGLVIWDHGGGLAGAAWDDTSGGDRLTVKEIVTGIDASTVTKFDIIGFDACQMAMAEIAFALKDLTDVFVASEENEPGDGWAYDRFLTALKANPYMTDAQLATSIVSSYGAEFAGQNNITLSAIATNKLTALDTALDTFITTALGASAADKTKIGDAAATAYQFPAGGTSPWRDIVDFMEGIMARTTTAALDNASADVINAVRDAVIAITGSVPDAEGLSINLPTGSMAVQSNYNATEYSFLNSVAWDDFLAIV